MPAENQHSPEYLFAASLCQKLETESANQIIAAIRENQDVSHTDTLILLMAQIPTKQQLELSDYALEHAPELINAIIINRRALALHAMNESNEALATLNKCPATITHEPAIYIAKAQILHDLGRSHEALAILQECPEKTSSSNIIITRASILEDLGQTREAIATLRSCPEETLALSIIEKLAKLLRKEGRVEDAYRTLTDAPIDNSHRLYYLRAQIRQKQGRMEEAIAILRSCPREIMDPTCCSLLAEMLNQKGEREKAIAALDAYPDANSNVQIVISKLTILQQNNEIDGIPTMVQLWPGNTGFGDIYVKAANILSEAGRVDDALELLRNCPEGTRSSKYYCRYALLLHSKGKSTEAIALLRDSPFRTSNSTLFTVEASILEQMRQFNKAIAVLRECPVDIVDDALVRMLARLLSQIGKWDEALDVFDEHAKHMKPNPANCKMHAIFLQNAGRYTEALAVIDACPNGTSNNQLMDKKALVLHDLRRSNEALAILDAFPRSKDPHHWNIYARILHSIGKIPEAKQMVGKGLQLPNGSSDQCLHTTGAWLELSSTCNQSVVITHVQAILRSGTTAISAFFLVAHCVQQGWMQRQLWNALQPQITELFSRKEQEKLQRVANSAVPLHEWEEEIHGLARSAVFEEMQYVDVDPVNRVAYRVAKNKRPAIERDAA